MVGVRWCVTVCISAAPAVDFSYLVYPYTHGITCTSILSLKIIFYILLKINSIYSFKFENQKMYYIINFSIKFK